jgi:glycosidase
MERLPQNPQLYEINARVWLNALSRRSGRNLSLGTIPQEAWERLKDLGMDLVWLMGVWHPSPAGIAIDLNNPDLNRVCREILPDFTPEDLVGSPYAVADYTLNPALGNQGDLMQVRANLHRAGLGLILDFVPNHTAPDHPWVQAHPERYVSGESSELFGPEEAFSVPGADGVRRWIARGRDPYFAPWPDTAQLCSVCPETRPALTAELLKIARWCDGLRCDMAMLPLNRVFAQTWKTWMAGRHQFLPDSEYWLEVLAPVKSEFPDLILIAEVYWGLENELLGQGFHYVYDKTGYDRLRSFDTPAFRQGILEEGDRRARMVRFLENHDEDRMAAAFPPEALRAGAVIHAAAPGLRLFHHGQLEGRRKKLPLQLGREPEELDDPDFAAFYQKLLGQTRQPLFKQGAGQALPVLPPVPRDQSHQPLVAFAYSREHQRGVIAVNFSGRAASGFLKFPKDFWAGWGQIILTDEMSEPVKIFPRSEEELVNQGLYVKLAPYKFHFLTASKGEGI